MNETIRAYGETWGQLLIMVTEDRIGTPTSWGSLWRLPLDPTASGERLEPLSSKTSESDLQDITALLRGSPAALRALEDSPMYLLGVRTTLGQVAALLSTVRQTPSSTATVKISSDQPFTLRMTSGHVTVAYD